MKNRLNKQIIKALALGISASMALQPLTVLANEGNSDEFDKSPADDNTLQVENNEVTETQAEGEFDEKVDEAVDAAAEVGEAIKAAEANNTLTPVVEETPADKASEDGASEDGDDVDNKEGQQVENNDTPAPATTQDGTDVVVDNENPTTPVVDENSQNKNEEGNIDNKE